MSDIVERLRARNLGIKEREELQAEIDRLRKELAMEEEDSREVAKALEDVDYKGSYAVGIEMLKMERKELLAVLELIAAPMRPDGTYNRCREACEVLARKAIDKIEGEQK